MSKITKEEFYRCIAGQKAERDIAKWSSLEIGELYQIISYEFIDTKFGSSCVITIADIGRVFAPSSLAKRLEEENLPAFVMPNGSAESTKNPDQSYYSYDLLLN